MTRRKTTKKPRANAAQNKRTAAEKPKPSTPHAGQSAPQKKTGITAKPIKPPKRKNVSQSVPNGTLIHTHDDKFYGADGNSTKSRMGVVVDSNRQNELAVTKYTTSERNGRRFENDKRFVAHGNVIYTLDRNGKAIVLSEDGDFKKHRNNSRDITPKQANQIKKSNLKESKYRERNKQALKKLKGRK